MQKFNYHCHTNFDGVFDGQNTADEMLNAYETKGFTKVGISNHCIVNPIFNSLPVVHPQFLSDINKAIDLYKRMYEDIDKAAAKHHLKIYKGFEVDFFASKEWRNNFEKIIKELKPDYLIAATHFLRNKDESFLCNIFYLDRIAQCSSEEKEEMLCQYWLNIIRSIDSGYFDFVAHFDYCTQFGLCTEEKWSDTKKEVVARIAAKKLACEINTGGLRTKRNFSKPLGRPFPDWWLVEELIKNDVPLLISDDAHKTEDTGAGFAEVEQKLKELNCKKRFKF